MNKPTTYIDGAGRERCSDTGKLLDQCGCRIHPKIKPRQKEKRISAAAKPIESTRIICAQCGAQHEPPPKSKEWGWDRWMQCQGCSIVLYASWNHDRRVFETEIQEGDDPYNTEIVELQNKHIQEEEAKLRIAQARLHRERFKVINGGKAGKR